jgi:hypothetical protein
MRANPSDFCLDGSERVRISSTVAGAHLRRLGSHARAPPKSNLDTTRELDAGFLETCFFLCAYGYFETEPDAESATKLMTRDESRRIAANVAKLSKPQGGCRELGHGGRAQRLSTFRWCA